MADNVLEPYTFSFGDANPASIECSLRVWDFPTSILQRKRSRFATFLADVIEKYASVLEIDEAESLSNNENQQDAVDTTLAA